MIVYHHRIEKAIKRNKIPDRIIKTIHNVFLSLELTKDFNLFDISILKGYNIEYYRLKKGKYRAIFHLIDDDLYVDLIAKREEVYKLWESLQ